MVTKQSFADIVNLTGTRGGGERTETDLESACSKHACFYTVIRG